MKSKRKGVLAVIFAILIVLQSTIFAFAATIPNATSDFYVNDFAKVFTAEEKNRLMENAVLLSEEYDGTQVVITTIKSFDGDSVEDYANEMYNQYGIGKNDMGILILLATEDREIRVEVGRAMEAYITDSKAGRFMDKYAIPYLKQNKFNEGLINLQENLINEIKSCIEAEKSKEQSGAIQGTVKDEKSYNKATIFGVIGVILIMGLISVLVFYLVKLVKSRKEKRKAEIDNLKKELAKKETELENQTERYEEEIQELRRRQAEKIEYLENSFEKTKEDLKAENQSLNSKNHSLLSKISILEDSSSTLNEELSTLKDRYRRVNELYPSADKDVDNMIAEEIEQKDMAKAKHVDDLITPCIELSARKDNVSKLSKVVFAYEDLTDTQKSYLKEDIGFVQNLYEESCRLKREYDEQVKIDNYKQEAQVAMKYVESILSIALVGTASTLADLKKAKETYSNLSSGAFEYFDKTLSNKVEKLLKDAKVDYEREQKIAQDKSTASKAEEDVKRVIKYISRGRESDLSDLEDALSEYERLNIDERKYFDISLLRQLQEFIEEAKRDKRQNEEERRRRLYNNDSDDDDFGFRSFGGTSSFGGSSSFGGFGGRSGGGGASRGF